MGLGASVEKCFRVVELWGNIPVIPVVTVWAADPEANRSRSVVAMPKSSASSAVQDLEHTSGLRGAAGFTRCWQGKGRKEAPSWLDRNGACKQYSLDKQQAGRSIEGRGEQGKKVSFNSR
jgi:hypothetical protein